MPLVLVTSSYVEPTDRELARRAGANDLVIRTPELGELIELLRATLVRARGRASSSMPSRCRARTRAQRRVFRQLERQVLLNTGLAKRCSALASELTVLTGISEAVLKHRDVDVALDEALAACFDAGGVAVGALYPARRRRRAARAAARRRSELEPADLETFFGQRAAAARGDRVGQTVHLPSTTCARHAARLIAATQASAVLVVPLAATTGPLGALFMVARGARARPRGLAGVRDRRRDADQPGA